MLFTSSLNTEESYYSRAENSIALELALMATFEFERQTEIGKYFADFYFPKYNLVLEIDGRHHKERDQYNHDRARDAYMNQQGYKVLRVSGGMALNYAKAILAMVQHIKKPNTYFINSVEDLKELTTTALMAENPEGKIVDG